MIAPAPGLSVNERVSPETLPYYRAVQRQAAETVNRDITAEQQRLAMSEMLHQKTVAMLNMNIDDLKGKQERFSNPNFYSGRGHYAALKTKLNAPEGLSVDELAVWRRLSRKLSPEQEYERTKSLDGHLREIDQNEAINSIGSMLSGRGTLAGGNLYLSANTTPIERRRLIQLNNDEIASRYRASPNSLRQRVDLESQDTGFKDQRKYFRSVATV